MRTKAIRVILQARLSSSRLPGKVLLPVANIPLIELAYRRASNSGLDVVVATSEDSSDDILANFLTTKNIPFIRGSLNNVLSRFEVATQDMENDSIIVRLTGDNLIPDGRFITLAIDKFQKQNVSYLRSDMTKFPYGLSVEVFSKKALDEAIENGIESFDQEHVTPYIRRKFGDNVFSTELDYPQSRVTIDYFSDYVFMNSLMRSFSDPVSIEWDKIISSVSKKPDMSKIVLGCAQLGNNYGITSKGKVTSEISQNILATAHSLGISEIDTARAYGDSESIIGTSLKNEIEKFKIITKLDHLIPKECEPKLLEKWIRESVFTSLKNLKSNFIDTLLFHRIFQINEVSVNVLNSLKSDKLIGNIGVSVNDVPEFLTALAFKEIRHIQLPANILDHRWRKKEIQEKLETFVKNGGVIHTRSAFLQGLLFCEDASIWPDIGFDYKINDVLKKLESLEKKYSCNRSVLTLRYLLDQSWVNGIVVGVENSTQLKETAQLFSQAQNIKSIAESDLTIFDTIPESLLTPSKWIKK